MTYLTSVLFILSISTPSEFNLQRLGQNDEECGGGGCVFGSLVIWEEKGDRLVLVCYATEGCSGTGVSGGKSGSIPTVVIKSLSTTIPP